ncbi:hypothetical protein, partial [Enterococcus faecium]
QRIEVKGLESGLARPRLVDLLEAIGGTHARFLASVRVTGDRTSLDLQAGQGLPAGANTPSVREMLLDACGDVTGRVVAGSV